MVAVSLVLSTVTAGAASNWSVVAIANPGGSNLSFLDGVSCKGQGNVASCVAVGSFVSAKGKSRALIERWAGKKWSMVNSPVSAAALSSVLAAVSCTSATNCMAVGSLKSTLSAPTKPLAVHWNGTSWKTVPTTAPSGSTNAYFNGVSCTTANSCFAVGSYTSSSTMGSTLIERWDGRIWRIMSSPNGAGPSTMLAAVSCTGAGAAATCAAVGSYSARPEGNPYFAVAARMVRGRWSLVATPKIGNDQSNSLTSVSCASAKSCFAAGGRRRGLGATLIERWNGRKWVVVTSVNPKGYTLSQFNGISCTTATNCVAAGLYSRDSVVDFTLINRWNGTKWTVDSSPKPTGAAGSAFTGVSCVLGSRCFAVGTYLTSKFANPPAGFTARHR
jgi:hypothetical protein